MENPPSYNSSNRPLVILIAEPEGLAINVSEILLANFCRVKVYSENISAWKKLAEHLRDNLNFSVSNPEIDLDQKADYLIFLSSLFYKQNKFEKNNSQNIEIKNLETSLKYLQTNNLRGIYVYPDFLNTEDFNTREKIFKKYFSVIAQNIELIILETPIGPRMLLTERFLVPRYLLGIVRSAGINRPLKNYIIRPLSVGDAARQVVKNLLSFSFPGLKIKLSGKKLSLDSYEYLFGDYSINARLNQVDEEWWVDKNLDKEVVVGNTDLKQLIASTLDWFRRSDYSDLIEEKSQPLPKKDTQPTQSAPIKTVSAKVTPTAVKLIFNKKPAVKKNNSRSRLLHFFPLLITVLVFPYLILVFTAGTIYLGEKALSKFDSRISRNLLVVAQKSAQIGESVFNIYSRPPLSDKLFQTGRNYAVLLNQSADWLVKFNSVVEQSSTYLLKVLGNEPYDVGTVSRNLALDLDALYRQSSFLEGEYSTEKATKSVWVEKIFTQFNSRLKRNEILKIKELVLALPEALGSQTPQVYLVLVQDSSRLRPTGGVISAAILLKFDKGRLVDSTVLDVDSLDQNLKGSVLPPEAFKKYSGQQNWYLKDANWDPDFPSSAIRAEWFLDKELGEAVDGVVGVDLKTLADLVEIVGGVQLKNSDQNLTTDNFFELSRDSLAGNKSQNFIFDLAQSLNNTLIDARFNSSNKTPFLIYSNLSERHLQVYVHQDNLQKVIADLGWDGSVVPPLCTLKNCYADWLAIAEANLGKNTTNFDIERVINLDTRIDKSRMTRNLILSIKNNKQSALATDQYQNYIRLYLPGKSTVDEIVVDNKKIPASDYQIRDVKNYLEAGIYIEVSPGQTRKVRFSWSSINALNFDLGGEYLFYLRKQAGVDEQAENITITFPQTVNFDKISPFYLTKLNEINYNTQSPKDVFARISFKKF